MQQQTFIKIARATLIITYLVIAAGGIVRMTGSGMGCPDWPKCFGQYIPPTDVSQLPENYQEKYKDHGYESMEFNVYKTWTEYINRLIGALSGLFVVAMAIAAFLTFWKSNRKIVYLALFTVPLFGLQAWLGKIVVDTILKPTMVTIHMVGALVIVMCLITIIVWAVDKPLKKGIPLQFQYLLAVLAFMSLVQVAMGTQVRQQIDAIAAEISQRELWIGELNVLFKIHRTFSLVITALTGWLIYQNYKKGYGLNALNWLGGIMLVIIISGIVLTYLNVPPVSQATHLVLAAIMFGLEYYVLLKAWRSIN